MDLKTISLPRLNNLSPTLESTALKLMEETGELAQAIGKFRGMNGEEKTYSTEQALDMTAKELLDVAQTAISMMFVLEEEYGIDIDREVRRHIGKLVEKGYIRPE